jgi:hypothetical protein
MASWLTVSLFDPDKLSLKVSSFNFNRLIEDCFMVINSMKGDKKIALVNETVDNLELQTDYHRLKRVILNLLTNALKYTIEGYISVKGEPLGDLVTIVVKDSGLGMDKESLNKLFKEFNSNVERKTESTRSIMNKEGIGLGLVTSLNLVEKLGPLRRIQVESEKGKGSRFSFQIHQSIDYKRNINQKKIMQNTKQSNSKKRFTSIFDRIFESEDSGRTKLLANGDNLVTQIPFLQQPLENSRQQLNSREVFNQQSSSLGTSSSGKKRINVFIYEAAEEVLEVRGLLEDYFLKLKSEFSFSFEYGNALESSIAKITKLEKEHQVIFDLVYSGIAQNTN